MAKIKARESQNIEYKSSWQDKCLAEKCEQFTDRRSNYGKDYTKNYTKDYTNDYRTDNAKSIYIN